MSLLIARNTTAVIRGQVQGGQIQGWRLWVTNSSGVTMKSTDDPTQILITDAAAGTFEVYLSLSDTAAQRNITISVFAQVGTSTHRLIEDNIQVS